MRRITDLNRTSRYFALVPEPKQIECQVDRDGMCYSNFCERDWAF